MNKTTNNESLHHKNSHQNVLFVEHSIQANYWQPTIHLYKLYRRKLYPILTLLFLH